MSAERPKGSAVLWAAWRAGLKDLQQVVLSAFPGQSMQTVSEPGSIANPTNLEVHEEKHPEARNDKKKDSEKQTATKNDVEMEK